MYPSQRIQESCQSGTKWLVETQVKARRRKRGVQKGSCSPPPSLTQKNTRLSRAAPDLQEREHHRLCARVDPRVHPRWRSRREVAFQSPYSSTEPLCSPRQVEQCLSPGLVASEPRHNFPSLTLQTLTEPQGLLSTSHLYLEPQQGSLVYKITCLWSQSQGL